MLMFLWAAAAGKCHSMALTLASSIAGINTLPWVKQNANGHQALRMLAGDAACSPASLALPQLASAVVISALAKQQRQYAL